MSRAHIRPRTGSATQTSYTNATLISSWDVSQRRAATAVSSACLGGFSSAG